MKKMALLSLANLIAAVTFAQTDYSGTYGFQSKVYVNRDSPKKPNKEERSQGHSGSITLFKIDKTKYKFWLSANRGWPSYNEGDINGIIEIINNKAVFNKKIDMADSSCRISFLFYSRYIKVEQISTDSDCGFGYNVFADGKYDKQDNHKLKNAELKNEYIDAEVYKVTAARTFLFEDAGGSRIKKQYFINGDIVLAIEDGGDFTYVESISASGKFIYGWLKKSDITILKK